MLKRLSAFAVTLLISAALICPCVCAADKWEGYTAISTAAQLNNIRNSLAGKYYLTTDITLNGEITEPIGKGLSAAFRGTFDGNGHTISGLRLNSSQNYVGLFGYNKGVISNLTLKNAEVVQSGGTNVSVGLLAGYSSGTLSGCTVSGNVKSDNSSVSAKVALIAGNAPAGSIYRCIASGTVTVSGLSASAGIICGASAATISECSAAGSVNGSVRSEVRAGGICGSSEAQISDSVSSAAVSFTSSADGYAGGIAGASSARVTNILCLGSVGLSAASHSYTGAVCGQISSDRLKYAYHNISSFSDGTLLSAQQLKSKTSFAGFDFNTVWTMDATAPQLKFAAAQPPLPVTPPSSSAAGEGGSAASPSGSQSNGNKPGGTTGGTAGTTASQQVSSSDAVITTGDDDTLDLNSSLPSTESQAQQSKPEAKSNSTVWIWIVLGIVILAGAGAALFIYIRIRRNKH